MTNKLTYSRILIKLSGEALMGDTNNSLDLPALQQVVANIAELLAMGVEVALVIGGGNLLRGGVISKQGLDRVTADQMGMLATMMNGLALRAMFAEAKIPVALMSSLPVTGIIAAYDCQKARKKMAQGKVLILTGGTGCPLVSTDSAASLRGIELGVDLIVKATKVDGVYSADPKQDKEAQLYQKLTYQQVLEQNLQVMDATAVCLCREYKMPVRVCNMNKANVLKHIVSGFQEGTLMNA